MCCGWSMRRRVCGDAGRTVASVTSSDWDYLDDLFTSVLRSEDDALLDGVFTPGEAVPSGDGLLRKFAHFAEFGALGLLLGWLFGMLGKKRLPAFALGVAAACIDETIQAFIPGRSPGIRDVCIDSCGAAAGMLLLLLGHAYWKKRFTRKISGGNET